MKTPQSQIKKSMSVITIATIILLLVGSITLYFGYEIYSEVKGGTEVNTSEHEKTRQLIELNNRIQQSEIESIIDSVKSSESRTKWMINSVSQQVENLSKSVYQSKVDEIKKSK